MLPFSLLYSLFTDAFYGYSRADQETISAIIWLDIIEQENSSPILVSQTDRYLEYDRTLAASKCKQCVDIDQYCFPSMLPC